MTYNLFLLLQNTVQNLIIIAVFVSLSCFKRLIIQVLSVQGIDYGSAFSLIPLFQWKKYVSSVSWIFTKIQQRDAIVFLPGQKKGN